MSQTHKPELGGNKELVLCCGSGTRSALGAKMLKSRGSLLASSVLPSPDGSNIWLVRPDGYVACAVAANEVKLIADYLDALRRKR
jgi:rhodanese-related sulfurtransferase